MNHYHHRLYRVNCQRGLGVECGATNNDIKWNNENYYKKEQKQRCNEMNSSYKLKH